MEILPLVILFHFVGIPFLCVIEFILFIYKLILAG